jgi:antitoxin component of MazEF toxin-antitoxin module
MHDTCTTGGVLVDGYTPCSVAYTMSGLPIPCMVHRRGNSLGITLAKQVRQQLPWRAGDFVAVRVIGEKIIIERIALEKSAIVRTGEAQAYDANLFER